MSDEFVSFQGGCNIERAFLVIAPLVRFEPDDRAQTSEPDGRSVAVVARQRNQILNRVPNWQLRFGGEFHTRGTEVPRFGAMIDGEGPASKQLKREPQVESFCAPLFLICHKVRTNLAPASPYGQ